MIILSGNDSKKKKKKQTEDMRKEHITLELKKETNYFSTADILLDLCRSLVRLTYLSKIQSKTQNSH